MSLLSQAMDYLGPRPGIMILRVKQGIVEIVLRVVLVVLVFFTFVCAAFLLTHLKPDAGLTPGNAQDVLDEYATSKTGCQWIIFVCWMSMLVQGVSIALRFLNLTVVERYIGVVFIVGIIIHGVFLISWFAGAISFAVRSAHWQRLRKKYDDKPGHEVFNLVPFKTIMSAVSGTSSFCFFTLFCEIVLTIWIVMWLVLRWQQLITQQLRYQPGPTQRDDDDDEEEENWVPEN